MRGRGPLEAPPLQTSPAHAYDESTLDYFESEILTRADLVYRFGIAITGSTEQSQNLVTATFQSVTKEFSKFIRIRDFNVTGYLLAECWRVYSTQGRSGYQGLNDETQKLVSTLPTESRVTLYAVDVAGLTPADAARAFGTSEKDVRVKLAAARRALLSSQGDV